MDSDASTPMPRALVEFADARLARQSGLDGVLETAARERWRRLAIASDFALDTLARQPALLARLHEAAPPPPPPLLTP
ncbi:MAG: hypothetical protein ACREVZ_07910, partial [Burkholderiales bacterium]